MSNEIVVVAPKDLTESQSLSKTLALSSLMPMALRKKPEDVLAIVLTGAELGLAPMQAVRGLHIINGRVSLSADLIGALVRRSPACEYLKLVESTGQVAIFETKRKGDPDPTQLKWTIEQARVAGLTGDNWKKYPDAMLRARCQASICRAVYPDVCFGLYDADSAELPPEKEVPAAASAQQAHVETVKADLKAKLQPEIEDAEIIEPDVMQAIKGAKTQADLDATIPMIRALNPPDIERYRAAFISQKLVISGAK